MLFKGGGGLLVEQAIDSCGHVCHAGLHLGTFPGHALDLS